MVAPVRCSEYQQALAVNLQFTAGRHGSAARIELLDRPAGRLATVALCGWVDVPAGRRIEQTFDDLAARGASQLLLDCSQLRHIDYRMVPALVAALARFESRTGSVAVCGLTRYLHDLFRLSGCDSHLHEWPSAAEVLAADRGPARGRAS